MLQVSQLYIYPIKSLGGIASPAVNITDRGFEHDRRWMLVDDHGRFISQREVAAMALLKVELTTNGLKVYHQYESTDILSIPFAAYSNHSISVKIWDSSCEAVLVSKEADEWFSQKLNLSCKLVYMTDDTKINIDERYNINNSINSFSDGYPILMIGEASLNDLNSKTTETIPMNRFRPNLVFTGGDAFIENTMKEFEINGQKFHGVKPCARCVVTTIDQSTAIKGKEPLRTLATYRNANNKIYFGENVIAANIGQINIGDTINILQRKATNL
jgi:hypothetical protein